MQYASGKDYLAKMTAAHQLTSDGRDWLTLSLDPFHDFSHSVAGYPDADCSQTVVQCFQYQLDVAKPAAAAANWDCHVYNLPQCVTRNFDVVTQGADWLTQSQPNPAQTLPTGILNVVTNSAGGSLGLGIPQPAGQETAVLIQNGSTQLAAGITRVIGLGYEVTNTTAELNKQGAVTAYRMPQLSNRYQNTYATTLNALRTTVVGNMCRAPPTTTAQANLLKGTRTWAAAEGAYVTCLQNSVHNPLMQLGAEQILYNPDSEPGDVQIVRATRPTIEPAGGSGLPLSASCSSVDPNQIIPFDTTGLFFTGLSPTTTLTIKLRVYVERAPTYAESDLAVLASPSAGYDVRALELYAAACNMLPVAVKVNENAKGDWWRAVTNVIRTVAGPVGSILNTVVPGAGLAGTIAQTVAGQIDTSRGKSISRGATKALTQPDKSNKPRKPTKR